MRYIVLIQVKLFLILAISIALSFTALNAQEQKVVSQEGNMLKVVIYGQNNNILQEGTIKNNKLHGDWASYDKSGNQLATGRYNKGKKVGKWFFWSNGTLTEVDFRRNIPRRVVVWETPTAAVPKEN